MRDTKDLLDFKLSIRITQELAKKISLVARANGRSIQDEVRSILDERFGSLEVKVVITRTEAEPEATEEPQDEFDAILASM